MADLPKTVCMGCSAQDVELAVKLPQVGVCPDCLTRQGWTLDSTADVLRRLGIGLLDRAQPGATVTDAEATPTQVSPAGTAPDSPAWMRPRRIRYEVRTATLEDLAIYLTAMTDAQDLRRVYVVRDEPIAASSARRWLLEINEPADDAPHAVP